MEDTITLVASDGSKHVISKEAVSLSSTLKAMLQSPFKEGSGEIELPDVEPPVMNKLVEYLEYKLRAEQGDGAVEEESFEIPPELSLQLLIAADYLNI